MRGGDNDAARALPALAIAPRFSRFRIECSPAHETAETHQLAPLESRKSANFETIVAVASRAARAAPARFNHRADLFRSFADDLVERLFETATTRGACSPSWN
jgi:hypothetical protein